MLLSKLLVIDLNSVLWYLESEEEFYDAPCSPVEEYFQATASIKTYQQNKFPELDCSKNMIQYKIRFEVPEVCIIVKLVFVSYFYSQLIYIVLLLIGNVAFILFKLNPDVTVLYLLFFVCVYMYVCVLIKSFLNFKYIFMSYV